MPEKKASEPFISALRHLVKWFQSQHVASAVIGGVAASLLGRPRLTRDIDILAVLGESDWKRFLAEGKRFGFAARRSDVLAFGRKTSVLLVRHETSGIDVDIVCAGLRFEEETVARAESIDLGAVRLPVSTPEDLMIMKAVAHRPRDMDDIEAVLDAHPGLDLRRVRRYVREFSTALERPDLVKDLEAILARRRKRARR